MYGLEQDGANVLDKQELRESLTARAGALDARYDNVVTLIVTQDEAIAQRFEAVGAQIDGKASAEAVDAVSARVELFDGRIEAITERQISTEAQVGNFYAAGLIRMRQVATESGALSTVAISAAVSEGGADQQAVITLSARSDGWNEIGLIADLLYAKSGSTKARPMYFQNGILVTDELHANLLRVTGTLEGNRINARTISADRLILGGITHTEILNGAVTGAEYYEQDAGIATAGHSSGQPNVPTTIVAQQSISGVAGRRRQVRFSASVSGSATGVGEAQISTALIRIDIRRGGTGGTIVKTQIVSIGSFIEQTGTGGGYSSRYAGQVFVEAFDYGGAANQQYTVLMSRGGGASGGNSASYRTLTIDEYRA